MMIKKKTIIKQSISETQAEATEFWFGVEAM